MKVLSYNARGLGGGEKKVEVRRLVRGKNPLVLCVQKTKLASIDDYSVKSFVTLFSGALCTPCA